MKTLVVAAHLLAAVAMVHAASSVTLTGTIGSRAILIVNGGAPKTVAVGESFQGVKLVSLQSEQAVVESEGKRVTLRMDTPVSIGLDYSKGQPVQMSTANGVSQGYRLRLQSVRVGDVEVYDIDAIVSQQPMPFVLLGNSFSMRRDADQMVLEKRY